MSPHHWLFRAAVLCPDAVMLSKGLMNKQPQQHKLIQPLEHRGLSNPGPPDFVLALAIKDKELLGGQRSP
jgi:hypothetical protein